MLPHGGQESKRRRHKAPRCGPETIETISEGGDAAERSMPKETSADKRDYPWLPSSIEYLTARPHNRKNGWAVLIVLVPGSIPLRGA